MCSPAADVTHNPPEGSSGDQLRVCRSDEQQKKRRDRKNLFKCLFRVNFEVLRLRDEGKTDWEVENWRRRKEFLNLWWGTEVSGRGGAPFCLYFSQITVYYIHLLCQNVASGL